MTTVVVQVVKDDVALNNDNVTSLELEAEINSDYELMEESDGTGIIIVAENAQHADCSDDDESRLQSMTSFNKMHTKNSKRLLKVKRSRKHIIQLICNSCSKSFPTLELLEVHQKVHLESDHDADINTGDVDFKSTSPVLISASENMFFDETEQLVTIAENEYKCKYCGIFLPNNNELKVHKRLHTGKRPYICQICGKCFPRQGTRNAHERLHSDDKPFKCPHCDKSYPYRSSLRLHQLTHTGEKPHKCDECGKGFTYNADLKRHQRLHSGEKPFKCPLCGMSFTRSDYLKRHEAACTITQETKTDDTKTEDIKTEDIKTK